MDEPRKRVRIRIAGNTQIPALLALRADLMARLDLPTKLLDAIKDAKKITNFEGTNMCRTIHSMRRTSGPTSLLTILASSTTGMKTFTSIQDCRTRTKCTTFDQALQGAKVKVSKAKVPT